MSAHLILLTALDCEARPIIDFYKCKKLNSSAFPIYSNSDKTLSIIVSKIGNLNAAAAVAYAYGLQPKEHTCFLNVGIAGSAVSSVGEINIANKITDSLSERSFYPWIPRPITITQTSLVTFDKPQTSYQDHSLIDMEAYGFFSSALHFVTKEQIQVVKIISDNSPNTFEQVTPLRVTKLIENQLSNIDSVVKELWKLSSRESEQVVTSPYVDEIKKRWHFTQYQQFQLKELLRRWMVICPGVNPLLHCDSEQHSQSVLQSLQLHLNSADY